MARNRTIPFGYMMQNGEITANPKEVLAVSTIFSEYLKGKSLLDIAKQMDVPYSDGAVWNKHMVKRILENEKYLGTDKYPQLIDEETFRAANKKKLCKAKSLCMISEDLQEIRKLTVCKECGHRLSRMGGCSRSEKWDCRNEGCYRFEYRMTDQMLIGAVLNALIAKERSNSSGDLAWNSGMVRKILHNEKYVGDVLLQKTYTVDCITHQ